MGAAAFKIGAGGRNGTSCLITQSAGNGAIGTLSKTIPGGSKNVIIVGMAITRPNVLLGGLTLFSISEGTSNPPNLIEQVRVELNTALGTLRVMRGVTVLGNGTTVIPSASFVYIELKVLISATVGTVALRINGKTELNLTNQNTLGGGNTNIDSLTLYSDGQGNINPETSFDDLYICDTLGAQNFDFLGDVRIQALLPTGIGATSAWTPVGAVNGWQCVAEVPNDGDTTYISSATPGQRDTFVTADLTSVAGIVKGVQVNLVARKDDAGSRTVQGLMRQGVTNYDIGAVATIAATYAMYSSPQELNPATGVAFTVAEINADEFGVDMIS